MNVRLSGSFPAARVSGPEAPDARGLRRVARYPGVIAVVLAAVFLSILPLRNSEAVINGPVVTSAPSWASFIFPSGELVDMCSGVLISDNVILSAKHCGGKGFDRATIGSANLNLSGDARRGITSFEGYSGGDDLGVFVLDQPVDEKPIALSAQDIHLNPQVVTLFGYGANVEVSHENDFLLHSVEGMSVGCPASVVPQLSESAFCLRSQVADQAPCLGDSGAPIVAEDGTLGAILSGSLSISPENTECMGRLWIAVSVTTAPVRTWVAEMIDKYEVNDEL